MSFTDSEKELFLAFKKYFKFSEEEYQVFMSRWILILRVLLVLVTSFRQKKLEVKYRNFMDINDISLMLFKNTEKQKKYEKSIKTNKKKKRLSAEKQAGKNKKKKTKKHLKELYHTMISRVSEIEDVEAKHGGIDDDDALRLVKYKSIALAAKVEFSKRVMKRSDRRKNGLDMAYERRRIRRLGKQSGKVGLSGIEFKEQSSVSRQVAVKARDPLVRDYMEESYVRDRSPYSSGDSDYE